MSPLIQSIQKNAIGLALFAACTAGIIATVYLMTADRIQRNERNAQLKSLYELAPPDTHDNDVLQDQIPLTTEEMRLHYEVAKLGPLPKGAAAHIVRRHGKISQIILPAVAPDGYTTHIRLWVGIRPNGRLAGVRVVQHQETPGLGDKIDLAKSNWILQFTGRSLTNPGIEGWEVRKDGGEFDQMTGATITPRAVVHAVRRALEFYNKNEAALLKKADAQSNTIHSAHRGIADVQ